MEIMIIMMIMIIMFFMIYYDYYQNLNNSAASDDGETCADAEANLKIMITLWK